MHAIFWMLMHSLWQGTLAAVLAGVIITGTRKQAAVVRYRLLAATLVLFVLSAGFTFCYELGRSGAVVAGGVGSRNAAAGGGSSLGAAAGARVVLPGEGAVSPDKDALSPSIRNITAYLDAHAFLIVDVWLICLFVQLIRLMAGLHGIRRIRHSGVGTNNGWNETVAVLAGRLGIKRRVALLESAFVKVPAAIGFFKPVILVPLGMLTCLPADQVQTILLHELAHIRRRDYLTNFVLHITEAVFFFNPGVRWINALIRREREACCDDMVLEVADDRAVYFDALVAFKEYMTGRPAPAYALGLGSERNRLLARIRRMLTHENKTLNNMEKTILSFSLAAVIIAGLISMQPAPAPVPPAPTRGQQALARTPGPQALAAAPDTLPAPARREDSLRKMKLEAERASMNGSDPRTMKLRAEESELKRKELFDTLYQMHRKILDEKIDQEKIALDQQHRLFTHGTDDRIRQIIEALKTYSLITDEDPLSFSLDANALIVNGKHAPEKLHQEFKERYLGSPEDQFIYDHHGRRTRTETSVGKKY